MSAKLLNAFADENPDLNRQIGCMSGLFQMFDRRHLLAGRHQKKLLLPGSSGAESHSQFDPDKNLKRGSENQRTSTESSRPSFSSSSSFSISSAEGTRSATQQDHLLFSNSFEEKPSINCSTPSRSSIQTGRNSDFRDFVKDSIYRENFSASTKTGPNTNVKKNVIRHQDSPRPVPLSKLVDRSYTSGRNGKSRVSVDVDESLGLVGQRKQSHSYNSEANEPRRSFEGQGREFHRLSCDSNMRSGNKLKELPRLSLGSREDCLRGRGTEFEQQCNLITTDRRNSRALAIQQDFVSDKTPRSVVAKLMGLEAMPNVSCPSPDRLGLTRSSSCRDSSDTQRKSVSILSRQECNKDSITQNKHVSNLQYAIETAPSKLQKDISSRRKGGFDCKDNPLTQGRETVYSDIDRKLEELEFLQSNKDFRALKQILDAIQAKRIIEAKKIKLQQQDGNAYNCRSPVGYGKPRPTEKTNLVSVDSPIVIMKPTKSMQKCSSPPATVIPLENLARLRKVRITNSEESKVVSVNHHEVRDRTPKSSPGATIDRIRASAHKKPSNGLDENRQRVRKLQGPSSPRPTESSGGSAKSSNSTSPRMQQKKLELEKKTRSLAPSDSTSPRRQSKQASESISPRGKLRGKPKPARKNNANSNEVNFAATNATQDSDEASVCSDISLVSQVDTEVTSIDRTAKLNFISSCTSRTTSHKENVDSVASVLESKMSLMSLREGGSSGKVELGITEQPSPISVLDASFYKDDSPPSSTNRSSSSLQVQESENCAEVPSDDSWKPLKTDDSSTGMSTNKLKDINVLLQKLGQLSNENASTSHVSELCNSEDPDQRYISETLLASGLLFQDLRLNNLKEGFHPDLFLVLEQRRSGFAKPESIYEVTMKPKPDPERLHRKLLFDTVNEIVIQKLGLGGSDPRPGSIPNGRVLLKELCAEVKALRFDSSQPKHSVEDEPDGLDMILSKDVARQSKGWTASGVEISGLVLDIERSMFKDLVDEIVRGESVESLQLKPCRLRRQLFAK